MPQLNFENEQEITEEESKKVQKMIKEFKVEFFKKHEIKKMTDEEINTRRNKLLDQIENQ